LLDKCEDFYNLWISLLLEKSLGKHKDKSDILAVVQVDFLYSIFIPALTCELHIGIDVL
jgi:hypothetical protein